MDTIDLDIIIEQVYQARGDYSCSRDTIKNMMRKAIHQALVLASEKARLRGDSKYSEGPDFTDEVSHLGADYSEFTYRVDKQSILDVNKLIK